MRRPASEPVPSRAAQPKQRPEDTQAVMLTEEQHPSLFLHPERQLRVERGRRDVFCAPALQFLMPRPCRSCARPASTPHPPTQLQARGTQSARPRSRSHCTRMRTTPTPTSRPRPRIRTLRQRSNNNPRPRGLRRSHQRAPRVLTICVATLVRLTFLYLLHLAFHTLHARRRLSRVTPAPAPTYISTLSLPTPPGVPPMVRSVSSPPALVPTSLAPGGNPRLAASSRGKRRGPVKGLFSVFFVLLTLRIRCIDAVSHTRAAPALGVRRWGRAERKRRRCVGR
ncbi:hypothetical protein B0H14DRAFT_1164000 [Mycena olivaceomarginata]|nr:hypothetical protein B0H14DRAFT_1164000 [Mycena olivaceomarginata]